MYKCKEKTYYYYDTLCNILKGYNACDMIYIISDSFLIHIDVKTLKSEFKSLLNLEVQVFEDAPYTFYL